MNSTRTLKSIIAILLVGLSISVILNIQNQIGEDLCVDYSQYNPSTLETGLIGDMVSTYKNNQLNAMNASMGHSETNSLTFDLETIDKFLFHIKKGVEANSKDFKNEKLGLRIYYAAYPQDMSQYTDLNDLMNNTTTQQYAKKLTMVMIPIRENDKNEIVDFNPFEFDTYEDGLPKYQKPEDLTGTNSKDTSPEALKPVMSITVSNTQNKVAQNHGNLFPPYPDTGAAF
ncbi:hypothetical protein [Dokdonia sp.]|uniref:hypothetical protein n=1 Tax=Dokdonia sp. TaxID=2024995 RepID=UPI003266E790